MLFFSCDVVMRCSHVERCRQCCWLSCHDNGL